MTAPDPDRLDQLGRQLDELQTKRAARTKPPPPNQWGIAFRFATDLVAGLFVGGGMGWCIDWLFGRVGWQTRPVFLILFFVLGAAAGIRNVIRTAQELNAAQSANEEK